MSLFRICVDVCSETATSWREVKNELDQILTSATTVDDRRQSGSRSSLDAEQRLQEARQHLDSLYEVIASLEQRLERATRRNTTLTRSLRETKQLLRAEHQSQDEGCLLLRLCCPVRAPGLKE